MRCARCHAENREGLRFCEDCGARLAAACPSCGAEVTPGILGKLYRRTGRQDPAQEHLTTATTMYREMDMRFWLEQAEAETRDLA